MNFISLVIIILSLLISTLLSSHILRINGNKKLAYLTAFFMNTVLLGIATVVLYKFDILKFHKETSGFFASLGILLFIFFIPIITLVSVLILKFRFEKAEGERILQVHT